MSHVDFHFLIFQLNPFVAVIFTQGMNIFWRNRRLSSSPLLTLLGQKYFIHSRRFVFVSFFHSGSKMAHSKWEYVRGFETNNDTLIPNTWAVARIDGRGFHRFAKIHKFERPNDIRGIGLMNHAAKTVMAEFDDIILSYGQSDEYSFVFRREADVFERRESKIITTLVSKFASAYVFWWSKYFPEATLQYPPSFDGRIVLYPTDKNLRDYLCWRQADCHINNLYNTTFWSLVLKGNMSNTEAEKRLSGTLSADKNEILFSQFNINYNSEPEIFRKGTVLVQKERSPKLSRKEYMKQKKKQNAENDEDPSSGGLNDASKNNALLKKVFNEDRMSSIIELNCDIIGDKFWTEEYPYLLHPSVNLNKDNNSAASPPLSKSDIKSL